mmetsp:Transcript_4166/g.7060  ORF Transcript_4166/g.7060 Transcript_4166/m.7060 type:complete len:99 (-) Transcript_4166:50-346(-)
MDELAMAGATSKLTKALNRLDVPCYTYLIFTTGGVDFVGGYTYMQFLKTQFTTAGEPLQGTKLGVVPVKESGDQIHEMMFKSSQLLTPAHWKQIVAYF